MNGFLPATSVGFIPLERSAPDVISKAELLEINAVPIGSLPSALTEGPVRNVDLDRLDHLAARALSQPGRMEESRARVCGMVRSAVATRRSVGERRASAEEEQAERDRRVRAQRLRDIVDGNRHRRLLADEQMRLLERKMRRSDEGRQILVARARQRIEKRWRRCHDGAVFEPRTADATASPCRRGQILEHERLRIYWRRGWRWWPVRARLEHLGRRHVEVGRSGGIRCRARQTAQRPIASRARRAGRTDAVMIGTARAAGIVDVLPAPDNS